jgi:hypothetical protein
MRFDYMNETNLSKENAALKKRPRRYYDAERRLNFEVQHWLVAEEALIGCFVSMSFSGSVV